MRKYLFNFILFLLSCLVSVFILELYLRVFDPIKFRLDSNKIILPFNQVYKFDNKINPKLDTNIIHKKNSHGFRGPDLNELTVNKIKLIAVGGSTTECYYLSDGYDWPNVFGNLLKKNGLDFWINNAGLDGHSTYGHSLLLENYILDLSPDIILFYIGINDIAREDLNKHDNWFVSNVLTNDSEILSTKIGSYLLNFKRIHYAKSKKLEHNSLNLYSLSSIKNDSVFSEKVISFHRSQYLDAYKNRLSYLVETCLDKKILPILITQPALYGDSVDMVTGIDLSDLRYRDSISSKLQWEILSLYNNLTIEVSNDYKCPLIDVGRLLPKRSDYFYDWHHYTNLGASKVAEIIFNSFQDNNNFFREIDNCKIDK